MWCRASKYSLALTYMLQCVAVCCKVLECVVEGVKRLASTAVCDAACCDMSQRVAVFGGRRENARWYVYCSAFQCDFALP